MRDLVPDLLPVFEAHRLDGLDAGAGAMYPFYEGFSPANLPASVCHWLGIPPFGAQPFDSRILGLWQPPVQNVILLVVDGLGLNTLQEAVRLADVDARFAVWGEIAGQTSPAEAALAALTSTVPSTTATVLTTFWTGCYPAQHGVLGYEMWLKEYNLIANMIRHNPASFSGDPGSLHRAGFSAETFLPVPTLGPHLARHGVHPYAFQYHSIARSGLSTMLFPGTEVYPFHSLSDLWVSLEDLLIQKKRERKYVYVYWADLDEHSHRFGPGDERAVLELASFSMQLEQFMRKRRDHAQKDTLLLVTADHGHIHTPRRREYELRNHPALQRCLVMSPSGEARLPLVFLRNGCEVQFLEYLEKTWPGQFCAIPSAQAITAGLFGSAGVYDRLPDRAGDYVVIPQAGAYWWFGSGENVLLGRHGGLSRTEMLVPLLSLLV